jgi:hypothetical protein
LEFPGKCVTMSMWTLSTESQEKKLSHKLSELPSPIFTSLPSCWGGAQDLGCNPTNLKPAATWITSKRNLTNFPKY